MLGVEPGAIARRDQGRLARPRPAAPPGPDRRRPASSRSAPRAGWPRSTPPTRRSRAPARPRRPTGARRAARPTGRPGPRAPTRRARRAAAAAEAHAARHRAALDTSRQRPAAQPDHDAARDAASRSAGQPPLRWDRSEPRAARVAALGPDGDPARPGATCRRWRRPLDDALVLEVDFGKFHGHTLGEIAAFEPSYIDWLAGHPDPRPGARAGGAGDPRRSSTGGGSVRARRARSARAGSRTRYRRRSGRRTRRCTDAAGRNERAPGIAPEARMKPDECYRPSTRACWPFALVTRLVIAGSVPPGSSSVPRRPGRLSL